jgi:hypothetical protein
MPDGTPFEFWDDVTEYTKVYHVACENPAASDDNPGSEDAPLATIGRAAAILQPGEKVVAHRGVYRECVRPARGGASPSSMIAYEAAGGEEVRVAGSRAWKPGSRPSEGWNPRRAPESLRIWMGDLPAEWFTGYNPFIATNMSAEYTTFTSDWTKEETQRFQLRRGMVFVDGRPLKQVFRYAQLAERDGTFWVEDPGLRIHFRLPDGADPGGASFEVTIAEQVFAPAQRGLGYIRVSGFTFEHAADGVPVPQRAMVSASRGHHWIIENNTIRWANACGIDVGNESWHASRRRPGGPAGGHVIRRNRVSDCGVCGMAGVGGVDGTLVEDNVVERIGAMNLERIWEFGGLKFHTCDSVLIRRNVFRHIRHAPGLWLDYLNANSRVTGNVFADIESLIGGVYIEVSHAPNVVDHNVFWDIRGDVAPGQDRYAGPGVNIDTGEKCTVAHNLFGKIQDCYAVMCHLGQSSRIVGGRTGLCRKQKIMNNVFVGCPQRILLSRADGNESDGNLFDVRDDATSFCVEYPTPKALVNLVAWQEYYGLDRNSRQAVIEADFDPETLVLTLSVQGELPKCTRVASIGEPDEEPTPGPFALKPGWQEVHLGKRA